MDPAEPAAPRRVLLVDDHPVFRGGLRTLLVGESWVGQVSEAGSVHEARTLVATDRPDIVTLDVELPDGSGLDALPELLRRAPEAAVALLTMHRDGSLVRRALSAGARGYVLKTTSPAVLVAALRTVADGGLVLGPGVPAVVQGPRGPQVPAPFDRLTPRQLDVATGVAAGRTTSQIARQHGLSEKTVRNVLSEALAVTGVGDRVGLALLAREQGLTTGGEQPDPTG